MKYTMNWTGTKLSSGEKFPAAVPGNIQNDWAKAQNWGNVSYGLNFKAYKALEPEAWLYEAKAEFEKDEKVFLHFEGIDYIFDILINGEVIFSQEGMFTPVHLDVTDKLHRGDTVGVKIYPHPMWKGGNENDRQEASQSVKPPCAYGWDWHPRVIPSGIFDEAYILTVKKDCIESAEALYTLADDLSSADVHFDVRCDGEYSVTLYDEENNVVGTGCDMHIEHPKLWWCNGQGEPTLYHYEVRSASDCKTGTIGFRRIRLVMGEGSWVEPVQFPKSRSATPATIEINGRPIFAKGSNWVSPDIFPGNVTEETYRQHIALIKNANMNILRCWGGSGINKKAFYDECDKNGILVWVEFPLACNNYLGTPHYLKILEQEARSIILRLRSHACVALWCGGNELFNNWSCMTDQSLALRLLNKLCYELDMFRPFIYTSPLCGMGHGGYKFVYSGTGKDCFYTFQHAANVAYTEFGVPGTPSADYLRSFIPENELFPMKEEGTWLEHHAFKSWESDCWLCPGVLKKYGCMFSDLEEVVEYSQWTQAQGYKAIFEEARRQKPLCGMAINWCWNEPWKCAANNSLVCYPYETKPAYFAVKESLRSVLFSARIPKFGWQCGEEFSFELWLLNDSQEAVTAEAEVELIIDGKIYDLGKYGLSADANRNAKGETLTLPLPKTDAKRFTLRLKNADYGSEYILSLNCKED